MIKKKKNTSVSLRNVSAGTEELLHVLIEDFLRTLHPIIPLLGNVFE